MEKRNLQFFVIKRKKYGSRVEFRTVRMGRFIKSEKNVFYFNVVHLVDFVQIIEAKLIWSFLCLV